MSKLKHALNAWWIGYGVFAVASSVHADEQLFGFVRGAETLPKGRNELYQFATMRTGKAEGTYYGFDFETEIEHGFTDKLQASFAVEQRYIDNYAVNGNRDAHDDTDGYRFGGISASAKYRPLCA